ncbi:MAG: hypothetical protein VX519_04220 [Myxococcota bacterium]|nr:hypothetical protein [Myxococcota bacterium]
MTPWILFFGLHSTVLAQETETDPPSPTEETEEQEPSVNESSTEVSASEETPKEKLVPENPTDADPLPPPEESDTSSTAEAQPIVNDAPVTAPPISPTTAETPPVFKPRIRPVGDLRTELIAARLDTLDPRVSEQSPQVRFSVSRARLGVATQLSPSFSVLSRIEVSEASEVQEYRTFTGDAFELETYPDHWRVQLWDLASTWSSGTWGTWTVGLQPKEFGAKSAYESRFYRPGTHHPFSMAEQNGVVPSQSMGVSWNRAFGARVKGGLQISNTTASNEPEKMIGKDLSARVRIQALESLALTASALMGPRDVYGQQLAWSAAAELELGSIRSLAEYIQDQRGESSAYGWGVTLTHEMAFAGGLESGHALVRIQSWDPDDTEGRDRDVTLSGSYLLSWTTWGDSELFTGLTYETRAPEDQYEAIEHGVVGQVRIVF